MGELADVAVVGVALRLGLQRGELLATRNYREFCHRYFDGRFLEHIPEIERKYDGSVRRTAEVIEVSSSTLTILSGLWITCRDDDGRYPTNPGCEVRC